MNPIALRLNCAALCLLLASSCAWPGLVSHARRCGVVPVESRSLPPDLSLRARLVLTAHGHEVGLDVIARAEEGDLVVVGISQAGPRLFALRQTGREIEVEALASELDSIGLWVMDALHRALFLEAPSRNDDAGYLSWQHHGEWVVESLANGKRRREFLPLDARSSVESNPTEYAAIEYPGASGVALGSPIQVQNPSCGYRATLVVLEWNGSGISAN